jgi:hypothetical protein
MERQAVALCGAHFLYYVCPCCGFADLFIDVSARPAERPEPTRVQVVELLEGTGQLPGGGIVVMSAPEPCYR